MLLLTLPAAALAGPLLLRRQGVDDYAVEIEAAGHGRLTVGRLMAVARGFSRRAWLWTVTGPAAPGALVALSGDAESREEAMTAFRAAWDGVRAWAAAERPGGRLQWHVPAGRVDR